MPAKILSLSKVLKEQELKVRRSTSSTNLAQLQMKMLRIQQGIWHGKGRAIIVFEGFDAAGKGGAIRRLTENLDPRGVRVVPVGPPTEEEQGRHYLYRFWRDLPQLGTITVFDRSWYGRLLVEKVEGLTPEKRLRAAVREINQFEKMLVDDGIDVIKIFLAVGKDEQLRRFQQRLRDPYKQWKLTSADVEARAKWDEYVRATDAIFRRTHTRSCPWFLIPADDKSTARREVLATATGRLSHHGSWMEKKVHEKRITSLKAALKALEG